MDIGSADLADLAALIDGHEHVEVRMALFHTDDKWQLYHGAVTVDAPIPAADRTWRYSDDVFLERRLPGPLVAALLREQPQEIAGLTVATPRPTVNGTFWRLAGHTMWNDTSMAWPRTEWDVSPAETMSRRPDGLLVGDGPSFLHYEAAYSSFFFGAPPSNRATCQRLWRIIQIDRRAWLHRIKIAPDTLTVVAKGTDLAGVRMELTTPTRHVVRPIGQTRQVRLRLPDGLPNDCLLVLRNDEGWLDYRYFQTPVPGQKPDASVVWDFPGVEVDLLIAGGEGPTVEFKQEVPTGKAGKKVMKTIAAFASGGGGTVLFGVTDDAEVVGVDPIARDQLILAVGSMIRNTIEPEPPYELRTVERRGKMMLLVEVSAGGRWYAVNPVKPEFYVRRGASTVPARMDEIATGFGHQQRGLQYQSW
ncbi:MAG TPA: ATP-binding protein [Mycobacteriales bacterium]|nr:ATP-binding protein [Mycobacteriales bacterium]